MTKEKLNHLVTLSNQIDDIEEMLSMEKNGMFDPDAFYSREGANSDIDILVHYSKDFNRWLYTAITKRLVELKQEFEEA